MEFVLRVLDSKPVIFWCCWLFLALVSLRDPTTEDFVARVNILFAGKSGNAVEHLTKQVREIGYYMTKLSRRIVIEEYSENFNAYKFSVEIVYTLRNFMFR